MLIDRNKFLGSAGSDVILRDSAGVSDVTISRNNFTNTTGYNIRLGITNRVSILRNKFNGWGATVFDSIQLVDGVSTFTDIQFNEFTNVNAGLFAIECAGDTQRCTGALIHGNKMYSSFCGISGRIVDSTISNNQWFEGNGNWRSGIEIGGFGNTITGNKISNGSIALAAAGDTGVSNTTINVTETIVSNNIVKNTTADLISLTNNIFDASGGSGTNTKVVKIGSYNSDVIVKSVKFSDNYVIGPVGVASTDGVRFDGLVGSGRVTCKNNTIIDCVNAFRLADDNFDSVTFSDCKVDNVFPTKFPSES